MNAKAEICIKFSMAVVTAVYIAMLSDNIAFFLITKANATPVATMKKHSIAEIKLKIFPFPK